MNKSTIAILILLLNAFNATAFRKAFFKVERSYHFLWLFKHSNFNLEVLETKGDTTETKVNSTDYVWYFWSGFQEKFANKDFTVTLTTETNGKAAAEVLTFTLEKTDDVSVLNSNWVFPDLCMKSETFTSKITKGDWKDSTLNIKLELTCPEKVRSVINDPIQQTIKVIPKETNAVEIKKAEGIIEPKEKKVEVEILL